MLLLLRGNSHTRGNIWPHIPTPHRVHFPRNLKILHSAPFFSFKTAQNPNLRCVLISDPSTLRARDKTHLESSINKCTPHCVCKITKGLMRLRRSPVLLTHMRLRVAGSSATAAVSRAVSTSGTIATPHSGNGWWANTSWASWGWVTSTSPGFTLMCVACVLHCHAFTCLPCACHVWVWLPAICLKVMGLSIAFQSPLTCQDEWARSGHGWASIRPPHFFNGGDFNMSDCKNSGPSEIEEHCLLVHHLCPAIFCSLTSHFLLHSTSPQGFFSDLNAVHWCGGGAH